MELTFRVVLVFLVAGVQGFTTNHRPNIPRNYEQPTQLLVVDTDGGIDDAMALLFLLSSHEKIPILALTCLFGNTDLNNACDNVLRILNLADRHGIPVHKGSTGSLTTGKFVPELGYYIGVDGLGNRSHEFTTSGQQFSGTPAALALSQLSRLYPGAITLLEIGPLTNLALAHRLDPYFTQYLREIVILGGNYNGIVTNDPEFNFKEDPLADNIVLTESACPITMVPFEATLKNGIPWDTTPELAAINTRFGRFFRRVSEVQRVREFQRGDPAYLVYDFVAAAVVLYPEIVTAEVKKKLVVEYEGHFTRGRTVVVPDTEKMNPVRIITDVNGTAIVDLFRRMLSSL